MSVEGRAARIRPEDLTVGERTKGDITLRQLADEIAEGPAKVFPV